MKKDLLFKIANVSSKLDNLSLEALSSRLDTVLHSLAEIEEWQDPSYQELTLEEEEELLQKEIEPDLEIEERVLNKDLNREEQFTDESIYLDLLKRKGITPISVRGQAYLGSGAYGVVFRGLWKGKEVAVKVEKDQEDYDTWYKYFMMQDSLSNNAKKHLPKVYSVDVDPDTGYVFIIMELLTQPPPYIKRRLRGFYESDGNTINDRFKDVFYLLKDPEFLYNAISKAAKEAFKFSKVPFDEFSKAFLKGFLELKLPSRDKFNDRDYLYKYLKEIHIKFIAERIGKIFDVDRDDLNDFSNIFKNYLISYMYPEVPGDRSYHKRLVDFMKPGLEDAPEVKSFIEALEELSYLGLSWHDLHLGNIMMRPSTKELVAIDIGGFSEV